MQNARRAALPPAALRKLADADAAELGREPDAALPVMPLAEEVVADYQTARLSLKGHPMQFLRAVLDRENVLSCADANALPDGCPARVAGVVLIRQRPGKGNAVFITIEDETGVVNALMWARDMERQRSVVMTARLMLIEGKVQRSKEGVVHLMAAHITDRTAMLDQLSHPDGMTPPMARADEVNHPQPVRHRDHPRDVRILPRSRDFH